MKRTNRLFGAVFKLDYSGGLKRAVFAVTLVFVLLSDIFAIKALAYFDKGPVEINLGDTDIKMKEGESISVSVGVNPASEEQLPGCGMAECPQQCGTGCLDKNGQCQCNGMEYQTYYAKVTVSSSDSGIAAVKYSNGVIAVKGISAGEATITVTGGLRQYTDSSGQIKVTVEPRGGNNSDTFEGDLQDIREDVPEKTGVVVPEDTSEPVAGNTGGTLGEASGSTPANTPVNTSGGASDKPSVNSPGSSSNISGGASEGSYDRGKPAQQGLPAVKDDGSLPRSTSAAPQTTLKTPKGVVDLIELATGATGKTEFESIMGKDRTATFQKKDGNGNVLYSWSFRGIDIKEPKDINMRIDTYTGVPERIGKLVKTKDIFCVSFAYTGELPGKAAVYLKVGDRYRDGSSLYLYSYNADSPAVELEKDNLKVENGYISLDITHCSDYFLSGKPVNEASGKLPPLLLASGAAVMAAAAGTAVFLIRKRKEIKNKTGMNSAE